MNPTTHARHPAPSEGCTAPVVAPGLDYRTVTEEISDDVLKRRFGALWWGGVLLGLGGVGTFFAAVVYLVGWGVGIWGINIPVAWGFAIINFVWWIGIGHAGTFISAFLLLLNQQWRTSINRLAEAMTLFAVVCAGLFPLLHLGRPWVFYWLLPYPSTMDLWPQFRSPLVWDAFAVATYGTVSLLFWYVGLVPDLATMRDRAKSRLAKRLYGALSLGWRSDVRHWQRHEIAYVLLAGLATPLVVSVHTVVSFDFAVALLPGWHSTIFPPYFVAGALFSGFAMVLTILLPLRWAFGLHGYVTERHLDLIAKMMLVTGLCVAYGYFCEYFMGWYSGEIFERYMLANRATGPYWPVFVSVMASNVVSIQFLWSRKVRKSPVGLWILAFVVNLGMWLERYMIVVTSLHRDFLPSSWGIYHGTLWDWATFLGSLALFFTLVLLFVRLLPAVSMTEMRTLAAGEWEKQGTLGGKP